MASFKSQYAQEDCWNTNSEIYKPLYISRTVSKKEFIYESTVYKLLLVLAI